MSDEDRLTRILQARTRQELDCALDGYREQVVSTHAHLQNNYPFNLALERKQYFHALCDLRRAARGLQADSYTEIILILERAAEKQLALVD